MDTAFELPCGAVLRNRLAKAAMSDELGDGCGRPTAAQAVLYGRWADGGAGLSIIGETQISPRYPENCANLVLDPLSSMDRFRALTRAATGDGAHLWAQLGHAGALAAPVGGAAKGPSALSAPGIAAEALSVAEIEALPGSFARAAGNAIEAGFTGVEIHAAHGFLLSQFLSPLFNKRDDQWGGAIENRARLLTMVIGAVRSAVGPDVPVGVKLNATDQIAGGLSVDEALDVISLLDGSPLDLIDISGGAYFPGAANASDGKGRGPYFLDVAAAARRRTTIPLMTVGGFKRRTEVLDALNSGAVDIVGLARAFVLDPNLPGRWLGEEADEADPAFPRFGESPPGGVTSWYTARIEALSRNAENDFHMPLERTLAEVTRRREEKTALWRRHFFPET